MSVKLLLQTKIDLVFYFKYKCYGIHCVRVKTHLEFSDQCVCSCLSLCSYQIDGEWLIQETRTIEQICWQVECPKRSRSDSLTSSWLVEQSRRHLLACIKNVEGRKAREIQGEWTTEWVKRVKRACDRAVTRWEGEWVTEPKHRNKRVGAEA